MDRRTFIGISFAALFAWCGWMFAADGDTKGVICMTVLCVLIVGLVTLIPCFYVITSKGVRIFYLWGFSNEYIPWDTVTRVAVEYTTSHASLYFFDEFKIYGKPTGNPRFYKKAEMVRTRRARKLIEQYTGRKIEGYMLDDFRQWRKDRRRKAEKKKAHCEHMKASRPAQKKNRK